ncbi:NAD(P)-binding protein [Trametopsis cervina]|nr:NAD(P)-binding protein [Trametopsis cervina]
MGKLSFTDLLGSQFTRVPPVLTADVRGKTVTVVGANAGIGLECAKHFARMRPARLILCCRNEKKGQEAAELIAKETTFRPDVEILDLSSFASVVTFTRRLKGEPIDILVLNAAVVTYLYQPTGDGWEEGLQVNHLSTALLSFLLVPNLLKAAETHSSTSRLVVVASEVHYWRRFDEQIVQNGVLAQLNTEEYCTSEVMATRYFDTKLLNVLFTRAFSQHLTNTYASSVVPTCANPGLCNTGLTSNIPIPFIQRTRMNVMQAIMGRTAEQGARQLVWAALGPDGRDGPHVRYAMSGQYVSLAKVEEPSDFTISREGYEAQEKVWKETIQVLEGVVPEVGEIVEQYFGRA